MGARFQIDFRKSNGNLHIQPKGDLDGSAAWQLIRFIRDRYDGHGRIFIDTDHIRKICSFGSKTFKCNLDFAALPADRIFFKGERGAHIAPRGSRIIVAARKHRCRGRCKGCACSGKNGAASGKEESFALLEKKQK